MSTFGDGLGAGLSGALSALAIDPDVAKSIEAELAGISQYKQDRYKKVEKALKKHMQDQTNKLEELWKKDKHDEQIRNMINDWDEDERKYSDVLADKVFRARKIQREVGYDEPRRHLFGPETCT